MMAQLAAALPGIEIVSPDAVRRAAGSEGSVCVRACWRTRRYHGRPSNLPSATGREAPPWCSGKSARSGRQRAARKPLNSGKRMATAAASRCWRRLLALAAGRMRPPIAGRRADAGTVNFLIESMPTNLDPRIGDRRAVAAPRRTDLRQPGDARRADEHRSRSGRALGDARPAAPTSSICASGVKFHDGRPFTSADVKFTFDSILSGAVNVAEARRISDASNRWKRRTRIPSYFHLSEPYASFLWNLTAEGIGIVPAGSGATRWRSIRSGRGRFDSSAWSRIEEIVLERNPDYFGGAPKIERVRFRVVPDAIVRALELRKGTADIGGVNSLTPDMVVALDQDSRTCRGRSAGDVMSLRRVQFRRSDSGAPRSATGAGVCHGPRVADSLSAARAGAGGVEPAAAESLGVRAERAAIRLRSGAGGTAARRGGISARARMACGFHLTLKTSTEESTRLLGEALAERVEHASAWRCDLRPLEIATFLCGHQPRKLSALHASLGGREQRSRYFRLTSSTRNECRRTGRIAATIAIPRSTR